MFAKTKAGKITLGLYLVHDENGKMTYEVGYLQTCAITVTFAMSA